MDREDSPFGLYIALLFVAVFLMVVGFVNLAVGGFIYLVVGLVALIADGLLFIFIELGD